MNIYILTFIITALYDVILRYISLNRLLDWDFVRYLNPYFRQHTLLAAALIAGFVGATSQYIIMRFIKPASRAQFMALTFIISALYGFVMKATGLFPILDETYYKGLGPLRGAWLDGVSGLIVQSTIMALL
tara:strand:+ start:1770 stop:2162 length:393 start_codon:yes stop_codon:yes gene_type:complete